MSMNHVRVEGGDLVYYLRRIFERRAGREKNT